MTICRRCKARKASHGNLRAELALCDGCYGPLAIRIAEKDVELLRQDAERIKPAADLLPWNRERGWPIHCHWEDIHHIPSIDLHGLDAQSARELVSAVLGRLHASNTKHVKFITGRSGETLANVVAEAASELDPPIEIDPWQARYLGSLSVDVAAAERTAWDKKTFFGGGLCWLILNHYPQYRLGAAAPARTPDRPDPTALSPRSGGELRPLEGCGCLLLLAGLLSGLLPSAAGWVLRLIS